MKKKGFVYRFILTVVASIALGGLIYLLFSATLANAFMIAGGIFFMGGLFSLKVNMHGYSGTTPVAKGIVSTKFIENVQVEMTLKDSGRRPKTLLDVFTPGSIEIILSGVVTSLVGVLLYYYG